MSWPDLRNLCDPPDAAIRFIVLHRPGCTPSSSAWLPGRMSTTTPECTHRMMEEERDGRGADLEQVLKPHTLNIKNLLIEIILTTPTPHICKKICPRNMQYNGGLYGIKAG